MLVLTRKMGEQIVIGPNVVVKVLAVEGNRVRLGVVAPPEVSIRRAELGTGRDPAEGQERTDR
jgi:carbon storage regulator